MMQELTFVAAQRIEFRERPRPVIEDGSSARPTRSALRGLRLPVYSDAVAERASEQLGSVRRLGPVLAVEPPPEPRAELWARVAARLPDLLA